MPTVIAQKVTGQEAFSAWRRLVRLLSGPAPGQAGLMLPPAPEDLAILPAYRYHPLGMERRRAETVRRVASRADWLEGALRLPLAEMYQPGHLDPGVGWWTAAESLSVAAGDADAVQVGDFHLPNQVAWNLAGEPRGRRRQDDRPPRAIPGAPSAGDPARRDGWEAAHRPLGRAIASAPSLKCESVVQSVVVVVGSEV